MGGRAVTEGVGSSSLGPTYLGDGRWRFRVWTPAARMVEVHLVSPRERLVPMQSVDRGYHEAEVMDVEPGSLYFYRLDGEKERPDPASRLQPQDVHGPSQLVDSRFVWEDRGWTNPSLADYLIYELHVGTYTPEGTFDALIPHLRHLSELGVTAVELMPVAQFPGTRNWGYDGVYPFAVQCSYGGPDGLKRLVNACHKAGLAVVLDVVYNHLGPEGNYLGDYGPYFTDRYQTPWGLALNFDGPGSDEVRRFFVENAVYWATEFHIDALRLDALHAIIDHSAVTFVEELGEAVHSRAGQLDRTVHVLAESDMNDARLVRPRELGGYGLDAVWNDDFHHALHTLLTGERTGYYQDFGSLSHLRKAFEEGFVYAGDYSSYRQRRHGSSSADVPACRFVVFVQNHDQVGNRMLGERLSQLVPFEALKLAAGVVLLSPFIPLLFMGEEYGEVAPFQYFTSHSDDELIEAVRRGRCEEFSAFSWQGEPPDPQDEPTFLCCKLDHTLSGRGHHRVLREFYKELIRLRRELPALASFSKEETKVSADEEKRVLLLSRWHGGSGIVAAFNFGDSSVDVPLDIGSGRWRKLVDSEDERWLGRGGLAPDTLRPDMETAITLSPKAFVLFAREGRHELRSR
jgi:maltooligosyltrehalose trehalohydrolase